MQLRVALYYIERMFGRVTYMLANDFEQIADVIRPI